MSSGYEVDPAALDAFGTKLDALSDNVRDAGETVGSCFMDVGLFGVVGQIFGAGASHHCREAGNHLNSYADTLGTLRDKLDKARQTYETQEDEVASSLSRYEV